jgi:hypothetical protein
MSGNPIDARWPVQVSPSEVSATAPSPTESTGPSDAEAALRLAQYGENAHAGVLERLVRFFWGPIFRMIAIDAAANGDGATKIAKGGDSPSACVVPTDEALMIARHA